MDPQQAVATELYKNLWMGAGFFLATNFGVLLTLWVNSRNKAKDEAKKEESARKAREEEAMSKLTHALDRNTKALFRFENDLQRLFTAVKIIAGKQWPEISKIIQEEVPRANKGFEEV